MFITFEGTEGSGKSTHIRLLAQHLKEKGLDVLETAEPGGTELGARVRALLLEAPYPISPEAETLLYMASRANLVREVIRPALKARKIVLCDRWLDATIAYQGYGLGIDVAWIRAVARKVTGGLEPDLTFFLDVAVETGLKRVEGRGKLDRIEKRTLAFHKKVRAGYLALARKHRRIRTIPVTSLPETQELIRREAGHVL